jgi:TolB-like protein
MSEAPQPGFDAPSGEVRAAMERVLKSQALEGSNQLQRLLRLVVLRTLDGQSDLLKEYNLGLEAFQRPPDYDPKLDPIVRVQARRLRAKLDGYYAVEGTDDPIVIRIPKGAYVPVFSARPSVPTAKPARRPVWPVAAGISLLVAILAVVSVWIMRGTGAAKIDTRRSVAVLPLEVFSEGHSRDYVADEVAEVLTTELAKRKDLLVLSRTTAANYRGTTSSLPEIARDLHVRWVVEGGVGQEGDHAILKLRVIDSQTDRKIWADVFDFMPQEPLAVTSRAANLIGSAIASEVRDPER